MTKYEGTLQVKYRNVGSNIELFIPNMTITKPKEDPLVADFDLLWAAWPDGRRKVNKRGALKAWLAVSPRPVFADVVRSLNGWKVSKDWTKNNGEYIPMPTTWINQRRWEVMHNAVKVVGEGAEGLQDKYGRVEE